MARWARPGSSTTRASAAPARSARLNPGPCRTARERERAAEAAAAGVAIRPEPDPPRARAAARPMHRRRSPAIWRRWGAGFARLLRQGPAPGGPWGAVRELQHATAPRPGPSPRPSVLGRAASDGRPAGRRDQAAACTTEASRGEEVGCGRGGGQRAKGGGGGARGCARARAMLHGARASAQRRLA